MREMKKMRCSLLCLIHMRMACLFCSGFSVNSPRIKQKSSLPAFSIRLSDKRLFRLLLEMDRILNIYLSNCSSYKFRAEKLINISGDIAEGNVEVIAKHGIKNLVMKSTANCDMTALESDTANKVMLAANRSCKLWFVSDKNLICTREINSDTLTPAPTSEERSLWNGRLSEASSSISMHTRSNGESGAEEGVDEDASIIEMLHKASAESDNFEKKFEETLDLKKMARLVIKLAKKLEKNDKEIRDVQELLLTEKQENDQLRCQIEEREQELNILRTEIEQTKTEKNLLRSQRDEYLNQIQVANNKTFASETRVIPPSQFICPISKEVMIDPYIAADGFTYEQEAISEWLGRGHSTSPMTNLALPHCNLIPNLVLRSAIQEWLQQHPQR